ncbi:MAG: bifunctional diaminohydroxyphosphoribosylaminopyrimidine deaminase/5-amino-6-(5-phosphoribosylamino)uracil reductase RibD [Verrucomicrobiae bacterium]|nr:bifunctional diaminohydroxyphosphoribosylaminopyrimidine deaminase/5-amino-6-(5-phosphoribosylamino)uracil reductase RibD [Verrucomicrobiae bacterium]
MNPTPEDLKFMRHALQLAARGRGCTSPNPMVGAVLVRGGRVLGQGWHHRAGAPHAEVEALQAAREAGLSPRGATLYVTLEPCCTTGRTPPCTEAIIQAGIRRVVVAATDPNPAHAGRGYAVLRQAGIRVDAPVLAEQAARLNWAFNHWVVQGTPAITVKAAMTLDGKLADARGQSRWITGERARAQGMKLRAAHDAIVVGVNTVLADDPALTLRAPQLRRRLHPWRRIILDPQARTPVSARVLQPAEHTETILVVGPKAPKKRLAELAACAVVWEMPLTPQGFDLLQLLRRLGAMEITALLVEGGGETQAAFLLQGWAQRVAFFYAPIILGGHASRRAVAGQGAAGWNEVLHLKHCRWRRLGQDWLLEAEVAVRPEDPS